MHVWWYNFLAKPISIGRLLMIHTLETWRECGKKRGFVSRNVISGKRQSFARHSPGELEVLTSSVHRTLVFLLRSEVGWKADS